MWFVALPSLHPYTFLENVFHTCILSTIDFAGEYIHVRFLSLTSGDSCVDIDGLNFEKFNTHCLTGDFC